MLLAVDAGNTQTVFGLFDGERLSEQFRVGTDPAHTADELAVMLRAFVDLSTLRETEPVGVGPQPPFLNGAAELETTLSARELLDRLLATEQRFGRTRVPGEHGPRTLDLDLLLYGDEQIDEPGLTVPHPRLHERAFVLEPLAELKADIPGLH